ncbi:MAG: hypothetical protein AB8B96_03945 [Lysobacterales bacterium]
MSTLERDIQFARSLAESGQRAPLLGGRFLVWWGAMVGVAYGLQFLLLQNAAVVPPTAFSWLWGGFAVLAPAGYWLLGRRYPFHLPGSGSNANQTDRIVWAMSGLMVLSIVLGVTLRVLLGDRPEGVFPWTVPSVFGGFAIALLTTGQVSANGVVKGAGFVSLMLVIACIVFLDGPSLYAIASAGAIVTLVLPGVILWRRESRSVD